MKYIKSKSGYFYKIYKNGKKTRISEKEYFKNISKTNYKYNFKEGGGGFCEYMMTPQRRGNTRDRQRQTNRNNYRTQEEDLNKFRTYDRYIFTNIIKSYEPNIFVVFTTGLADEQLRQFWFKKKLHLHILQLIPQNFTNVKFIHFDPDNISECINDEIVIKFAKQRLSDERITESSFYKDCFPFKHINFNLLNHILLDFAHLFIYEYRNSSVTVKTSDHYTNQFRSNNIVSGLKSIYMPYDDVFSLYLVPLFKYEQGQIITFIEQLNNITKLSNRRYQISPMDYITDLIDNLIRYTLYQLSKNKKMNMNKFNREFLNNTKFKLELAIKFMNDFLWSGIGNIYEKFEQGIISDFEKSI